MAGGLEGTKEMRRRYRDVWSCGWTRARGFLEQLPALASIAGGFRGSQLRVRR